MSGVEEHFYRPIIDHVSTRLSTWKSNCLNMAGRITLASSMLTTIPQYTMQTTLFPKKVCTAIERIIRRFIWRDSKDGRRIHLIKLDMLCRPKSLGGIGLRSLERHNLASMTKLAWFYVNNLDVRWSE